MSISDQIPSPNLIKPLKFSPTFPPIFSHFLGKIKSTTMFSSPFVPTIFLLISLPLIFLLAPRFLPPKQLPISLPDELDDLSLFQRASAAASAAAQSPPHPSAKTHLGGAPKIAFLFLTNSDLHFSALWQRFFGDSNSDMYNIYIHADPTVKINPPGGVFEDRFIASKKTQRASATLISAARRLLATALLDDRSNAYFAIISQHCIPLHSFKFVYRSLFNPSSAELTQFRANFKYRSFIEILNKHKSLWGRYNSRGKNVMLPEVPFEKFRFGSQFFVLTRQHSLLVIRDRRLWRKFKLPCYREQSCYPEEHYFPTLLSMEDPKGCTHYTLTRVNWTGTVNGHPHTYHPPEVSAQLIYQLRESNSTYSFLFARKFSPDCLDPLLEMADSVIFKD